MQLPESGIIIITQYYDPIAKEDIKLDKDALSVGVQPIGGLFSTAEIKILICYILDTIGEPVPANELINTLHFEGIANAFELSDAITLLSKSGLIAPTDESGSSYIITRSGSDTAKTLRDSLSYVVKERACAAALKMLAKFKNAQNTDIKITHEDGRIYINCTALDRGVPFIGIKLLVGDETQALAVKESFLERANKLYPLIIQILTAPPEK